MLGAVRRSSLVAAVGRSARHASLLRLLDVRAAPSAVFPAITFTVVCFAGRR
jgi:hypothetical protein